MRVSLNHPIRSGQTLATFKIGGTTAAAASRSELVIHGMEKTPDSLVLVVTVSAGNQAVEAGRLYTFGEGEMTGGQPGRFDPVTMTLDVTDALAKIRPSSTVMVTLKILDAQGAERRKDSIVVDEIELRSS
jgi:hypothetical protein